jgi:ferredoxin-NADP reductase
MLRQVDAIVTVTTTKTIIREHETDLVVREARAAAADVVVLTLADPRGGELPPWTPGAHVDLILGDDLTRQYSLCSSPSTPDVWRLGVLRAPDSRGGSDWVHTALGPGTTVRVRGPRNHFPLVSSPRYLFIAGGIGITPILPMIAEAEAAGADWHLHYGGRQRASMAFLDELAGYGDRVTIVPQDEVGMLDLESILGTPQPDTLVYCCGPEGLLSAVEQFCESWPSGILHLERFSAKPQEPAAARQVRPHRDPRSRCQRPCIVSGGSVRHLRDRSHRRRCRSPRFGAQRGGASLERIHDGLCFTVPVAPTDPQPMSLLCERRGGASRGARAE